MNDTNITEPMVSPTHSDSNFKEYRCPHCDRFLFKGNVKKLNMVCHHCQKMINVKEDDFFKTDNEEISND